MARQFTGSQYGSLTDPMLDPAQPYTLLAWIKKSALEASDQFIFGSRRDGSFERTHGILYRGSSGTTLNHYNNGGSAQYVAGTVPALDDWVPVIVTRVGGGTGTQNTSINVDGVSATGGLGQSLLTDTPVVSVGAAQYSNTKDRFFTGLIGAVAKWNSVLSAPDQAALIAGADPATIDSGNLYESWVFDSDTGATSTGTNGKVLAWTGSPAYVSDSPFATGPTVSSITDPISDSLSITVSNIAAVDNPTPTPTPSATLITSENFELGTLGTFTQVAGTRAAAVTNAPRSGTYALRMNLMGAEPTPDPITGNDRDGLYTANTDIGTANDADDVWYMSAYVRFDDADNRTDANDISKPKLAYFSDMGHGGSETQNALFPTLEPSTGIRSWYANESTLSVLDGYGLSIYGEATGCGFGYDGNYHRFEFKHDRVAHTVETWINGIKWLPTGAASIAQAPDGKLPVHAEFRINHIRWFHQNESGMNPANSLNRTGEKGGVQVDDFEVWSGIPVTASVGV